MASRDMAMDDGPNAGDQTNSPVQNRYDGPERPALWKRKLSSTRPTRK
jgi:hypothetical protein